MPTPSTPPVPLSIAEKEEDCTAVAEAPSHSEVVSPITPRRSHPAQHGEGFDAPPSLERSGSEHRRAVTSFLLRRKAWLEVELSLQERRRGRKVSTE